MKKIVVFSVSIMLIALLLFACNSNKDKAKAEMIESELGISVDTTTKVVKFEQTLFSVPSPYQVSLLVKEIGLEYNEDLQNSSSNYPNYSSTFQKSINLGIYGADLAYANSYEQSSVAIKYFSVIKRLSQDLGLTSAINMNVFTRIEANVTNQDSLLYIISNAYSDLDFFLKENQRQKDGALVLVGGWVESMYILSNLAADTKHTMLIQRVGENRQPLESIIKVISPYYKESEEIASLVDDLVDLSYDYQEVKSNYTYIEPIVNVNGRTTKITSQSKVVVSDEVLAKIVEKIKSIRNKLIA